MSTGEKIFVIAGFIIAVVGLIPVVANFTSFGDLLSNLVYYSPFLTPALISGIALKKKRVGAIAGSIGLLMIIVALPMLWLLYSISFGDTNPEAGIVFLLYSALNIPLLVGATIALLITLAHKTNY